jgi:hypothetical protein
MDNVETAVDEMLAIAQNTLGNLKCINQALEECLDRNEAILETVLNAQ